MSGLSLTGLFVTSSCRLPLYPTGPGRGIYVSYQPLSDQRSVPLGQPADAGQRLRSARSISAGGRDAARQPVNPYNTRCTRLRQRDDASGTAAVRCEPNNWRADKRDRERGR